MVRLLCFCWIFISLVACKSEKPCKYKPSAIFSKELPHVVAYNFEVQGSQSLESIQFDSNILLEIGQEVCNGSRQEYRFTAPGTQYASFPDSLWLKEAARQFVYLSTLSPKQAPLRNWADLIEERRQQMKLGEDQELQQGIFLRIDRVISPEQSILVVVLSQTEEK